MKKRAQEITHYSSIATSVVLLIMALLFILLVVIVTMHHDRQEQEQRKLNQLAEEAANDIRLAVNDRLSRLRILALLLTTNQGTINGFSRVAAAIAEGGDIESVSLAPGCVVSDVYPRTGNESVMNRRYLVGEGATETDWALQRGVPALTEPVVVEWGKEYTWEGRVPVYINRKPWGVVGARLAFPGLVRRAFTDDAGPHGYVVALSRVEPGETWNTVFWQSEGEPFGDPGRSRVRLHNLSWDVAVYRGRDAHEELQTLLYAVGLVLLFALVAAMGYHYRNIGRIRVFMENLAMTDGLTGLPNRRSIINSLGEMIESAKSSGQPLVLLYMDLNGFKQVNDTHGHDKGDRVLVRTADILKNSIKDYGVIGRVGGDEFVFLLSGVTPGKMLDRIIEVLCERLQMVVSGDGEDTAVRVPVSASFGYAAFPMDGLNAEALLHKADIRMYATKKKLKGSERMGPYRPNFR